jgi:hypothetical protein
VQQIILMCLVVQQRVSLQAGLKSYATSLSYAQEWLCMFVAAEAAAIVAANHEEL